MVQTIAASSIVASGTLGCAKKKKTQINVRVRAIRHPI